MAPRRGGGGGGGYGRGGGSSSQCSDNNAFTTDYSKGTLAIMAIFLGVDLLILTLWVMKRARNSEMKKVVRWWNYGLSLLLSILSKILFIIALCLSECGITGINTFAQINTASGWFGMISDLLLLSILIITLCGVLYQHASAAVPKILTVATKWTLVAFLVLITILGIASTALASDINANLDNFDFDSADKVRSSNQLSAAYWFLFLFAIVIGTLTAGHGVWGIGKRGVKSGSLKFLLPALFLSWLIYIILRLVYTLGFALADRIISPESSLGLTAVQYFFLAAVYIIYLYIASARATTTIPTSDPVAVNTGEPKFQNGVSVGYAAPAFQQPHAHAAPPAPQNMGYPPQHQNGTTYPPQQVPGGYGYAQPQQQQQYAQQIPSPPPQHAYEVPAGQQYPPTVSSPSPQQAYEVPAGQQYAQPVATPSPVQQYGAPAGQQPTHRYG